MIVKDFIFINICYDNNGLISFYENSRFRKCKCSGTIMFFLFLPRIVIILPPLPREHWAALVGTEIGQIGQPIGVTVHIALRTLKISWSDM